MTSSDRAQATNQPIDPAYQTWLDQCERDAFNRVPKGQVDAAEARLAHQKKLARMRHREERWKRARSGQVAI